MGDETTTETALAALLKESELLDELQRGAERVNILDVFGIARHELAHSAFWAWLWDPNGSHRMGDRFLRAFLRHCSTPEPGDAKRDVPWTEPDILEIEGADLARATVQTESSPEWMAGTEPDGDRIARCRFDVRIDVPLGDGENALVIVEFKIEARERDMQTDDYRRAIEAVTGEGREFASALAVFVDLKSPRPDSPAFLPVSLRELVRAVIDPIADSCGDLMPASVASLLDQYRRAVGNEYGDDGKGLEEFCGRHAEALAALREHVDWRPGLTDLVRLWDGPDAGAITFRDTRDSPEVEGTVRLREDGRAEILVRRDGRETGPFSSLSAAAQAAGRASRSYNGWAVWRRGGVPLAEIRDRTVRGNGRADEYCRAILNGRRLAVDRLLSLAGDEAIPAAATSGKAARRGTLLTDLVSEDLLRAGQTLRFRGDDTRVCTVEMRGDRAVLVVEGEDFATPSGASRRLNGDRASSGFVDLRYRDEDGTWRPLEDLRDEYRRRLAPKEPEDDEGR